MYRFCKLISLLQSLDMTEVVNPSVDFSFVLPFVKNDLCRESIQLCQKHPESSIA